MVKISKKKKSLYDNTSEHILSQLKIFKRRKKTDLFCINQLIKNTSLLRTPKTNGNMRTPPRTPKTNGSMRTPPRTPKTNGGVEHIEDTKTEVV